MTTIEQLPGFSALTAHLAAADRLVGTAHAWVRYAGPETWLAMGGVALAMLWLWRRRPLWL